IITDPSGSTKTISVDAPKRDGLYIPEYTFTTAGTYKASLLLKTDLLEKEDRINLEDFIVHQDASKLKNDEEEEDGAITFLLEQQWKIPVTYAKAQKRDLSEQLRVTGQFAVPAENQAKVASLQEGILEKSATRTFPKLGDMVNKGDVLCIVKRNLTDTEQAEFVSNKYSIKSFDNELKMRSIDLEIKQLELTSQTKTLEVQKDTLNIKLQKYIEMKRQGLITELELIQLKSEIDLINKQISTTKELQSALLKTANQLQKSSLANSDNGSEQNSVEVKIIAPITGQIVEVHKSIGESCSNLETIFKIQDYTKIYLKVNIPETKADEIVLDQDLFFQPLNSTKMHRLSAISGRALNLNKEVDHDTRTFPLFYEIPNKEKTFRAGTFVNVFVGKGSAKNTLSIPESAIVRDNGLETVYVILDGEHFTRRVIRTGVRDKGFVEVLDGLKESEWIADKGAYLVKLASRSSEEFGHGHGH
ncbi:MAG: efflux RND transporter periplasmic adaptor subunit, partial [Lentisphaeraceae bacterium]|nr:efflux RND transporter periplasmic adaptor subunit [Lentisphaeraceae bacterium]